MTLQVPLSEETESQLRAFANANGKDVLLVVADAIAEKLAADQPAASDSRAHQPSAEEWIAALNAWAASHARLDYVADDSRESIYAGCGE